MTEEKTKIIRIGVMVYFEKDLLDRLMELCKKRGSRRSNLIQYIVSKALEDGNV